MCAMFDVKVLNSVYARVLPEEGLGYGPVVTVLRLHVRPLVTLWFRIME